MNIGKTIFEGEIVLPQLIPIELPFRGGEGEDGPIPIELPLRGDESIPIELPVPAELPAGR